MPSYIIHLAVAKKYLENHEEENIGEFYKGVIEPDLRDKKVSHYGKYSSTPDLQKYYSEVGLETSFNRGYFLHLVTDYLFYNKFLESFSTEIYKDYNRINERLIKKYNINIPKEIVNKIEFEQGTLSILDFEKVCQFIDTVGMIKLINYKSKSVPTIEDSNFLDI